MRLKADIKKICVTKKNARNRSLKTEMQVSIFTRTETDMN